MEVIIASLISSGAATIGAFIAGSQVALTKIFIFTFVSTAVMGGVGYLMSKGSRISASMGNLGSKFVTRAPSAPTQIVYGETRVGGTLVFVETSGTNNKLLHLVAVFAAEEIEGFTGLKINDVDVTINTAQAGSGTNPWTSGGTAVHDGTYYVTDADFTNTDNADSLGSGRLCSVQFYNGHSDQDHSSELASAASQWDSDHDLRGLAYCYIKLVYDAEKWSSGMPALSVTLKGRRPEDPRKATTLNGAINNSATTVVVTQAQASGLVWRSRGLIKIGTELIRYEARSGNSLTGCVRGVEGTTAAAHSDGAAVTTRQWTENPALCLRDYLTSSTIGLSASASEINDLTTMGGFMAAANECDETVTIEDFPTSGTDLQETRYTCNGSMKTDASPDEFIRSVCTSMLAQFFYTAGEFNVTPHQYVTPAITLTEDDCVGPLQINRQIASGAVYNGAKVTYADSTKAYQTMDAPIFTSTAMLNEDTPGGTGDAQYRKYQDMSAPYTTTGTEAQRLGILSLKSLRTDLQIQGTFTLKALQLQPSDTVMITNSRLGLSSKVMKVMTMEITVLQDSTGLGVNLVMVEDNSADYTITAAEVTQGSATAPIVYSSPNAVPVQADSGENPFQWSKSEGTWTPSATTKDISVYFYRAGATIATHVVRGTLTTGTGNIAAATQGSPSGEATTISVSGSGTGTCIATISHTDSGLSNAVTFRSSLLTNAPANPTVYAAVNSQGESFAQWLKANNVWEPSEADQTMTAKFYREGTLLATQTVTGDLNTANGTIDVTVNSPSGTESGKITSSISNDNTVQVDVKITHTADNADDQQTHHDMRFTSQAVAPVYTSSGDLTWNWESTASGYWAPANAQGGYAIILTPTFFADGTEVADLDVTGTLTISGNNEGNVAITNESVSGTGCTIGTVTNNNTVAPSVVVTHTASGLTVTVRFFATAAYSGAPDK